MSLITKRIETSYNLLDKNYKIIVIATSVFLVFFLWHPFLTELLNKYEENKKKQISITKEVKILNEQLTLLKNKKKVDVNAQLVAEENQLKKNLSDISQKILQYQYQLISYKQMFINLKDILKQEQNIQLLSIKQFPEELVKDTRGNPFYQHPIELSVKGTYLNILNYLKKIEQFHAYIFWDELMYRVIDLPDGQLDIKFHIITSDTGQENAVK